MLKKASCPALPDSFVLSVMWNGWFLGDLPLHLYIYIYMHTSLHILQLLPTPEEQVLFNEFMEYRQTDLIISQSQCRKSAW